MEKIEALERLITVRIIQEDAETIYSLLNSERDSIFALGCVPYYALFVKSCQEYMKGDFLPPDISLKIADIRNYIKVYSEGFGKTRREISKIDSSQDESFKQQLTFPFMKDWNIHLNLGICWTDNQHMVRNSQQVADMLNIEDPFAPEVGEIQRELGKQIRSFVEAVRSGFANIITPPIIERSGYNAEIPYYYDLNTNKRNSLFINNSSKELNLFYLNLLCNLNFVKYILRPLLNIENNWLIRVEYVNAYYTFKALERLKNFCENNYLDNVDLSTLGKLTNSAGELFDPKIRGCMMHYGMEGQGVISTEYVTRPFYGIFESCLEKDFYLYLDNLYKFSDAMISYLENNFDWSGIRLESFKGCQDDKISL